jgi:hemerythrin superfamily protein
VTGTADGSMLSDDHREVDVLLTTVLEKLRGEQDQDAFKALDLFWARLAMHIRAEHLHLFPAVMKFAELHPELPETLERLRRDHDFFMHELADAIKAMRSMTSETEGVVMRETVDRLEAIGMRLAEHNSIEEDTVYPLQLRFPAEDVERLSRLINQELRNLPPRFRSAD